MKYTLAALMTIAASPVLAASKNPFSSDFWHLDNTDMIVLIAFIIFVGVLIKFKVPGMLTGILDKRAAGIKSAASVTRRLAAAEDQITSAKAAAIRDVRNQAVTVAVAAAQDVIAKQTTAADANALIDDAISVVGTKLH